MRSSVVVALLLLTSCTQSDDRRITSEVARLETSLKRATVPAPLQELAAREKKLLAEVPKNGSMDERLRQLREPFIVTEALAFMAAHANEGKNLAAFETLWQKQQGAFAHVTAVHGSVVRRGLYQRAVNRAQVLAKASLPYGRTSSPEDGLYYLGEAEGNRRFGEFVASLHGEEDAPRPAAATLNGALVAAEQENLAAFERKPDRDAIMQSAKLKEARELIARGWLEGASLLLDAKRVAPLPVTPAKDAVTVTLVRWPYT